MNPCTALELERCRRDRRKLLEFLISSPNLLREVRLTEGGASSSSLSSVDLDTLSADYVLHCISSGGGVLDVSEAKKNFCSESDYPIMIPSQKRSSYFTISDPTLSSSPPQRAAPSPSAFQSSDFAPQSSIQGKILPRSNQKIEIGVRRANRVVKTTRPLDIKNVTSLGLPPLKTGLTDDDLRESAYEILLATIGFSGIEVLPEQGLRREKSSKFLSGLKNKKDKVRPQSECQHKEFALIDSIRLQMQVSEATDLCIRQKLMLCISSTRGERISVLQILLEFINNISRTSFLSEKSYCQWIKRQANILEELIFSSNKLKAERSTIKDLLGKIRNAKEWNSLASSERTDILASISNSAIKAPGQFGNGIQNSYETVGYHLKIRFYEQLLLVVFDILDEGQLIKETDEVLKLIKSTWSTLGITQIIHDTLFGWVFFKQFIKTGEDVLLEYAIHQLQEGVAGKPLDEKERKHLGSLVCSSECNGSTTQLNLVQSIFASVSYWFNSLMQDYHLHFSQPSEFRRMMTFAVAFRCPVSDDYGEVSQILNTSTNEYMHEKVMMYVHESVQAAYARVIDCLDSKSEAENMHPLVRLADGIKSIIDKEGSIFCPVVDHWCPEAWTISSTLLHQAFEENLEPFLQGISSFSQDVRLALSAAHALDKELTKLHMVSCKENEEFQASYALDHYHIGDVSGPLLLDWVMSQHAHILAWIDRALHLEDWEPLSSQQKHAVSVVEVFRMIEETVNQFFTLKLPVNITHLQALLSVIIHGLDAYLTKVVNQLVDKSHLYPPIPSLTRYGELVVSVVKKRPIESNILDNKVDNTMNELTLPKLCIRLNSVNYIKNQLNTLELEIRKSWGLVKPAVKRRWFNIEDEQSSEILERTMSTCDESVDELFVSTFDGVRIAADDAVSKIVDFLGARIVFLDLKEPLLHQLYHGSVEGARMDNVLVHIDSALNCICALVDETTRDPVALSIFRSLLVRHSSRYLLYRLLKYDVLILYLEAYQEGYVWVLLDGGPSRAFSESDFELMQEDFKSFKDFFVADGEGLPRSLVEKEAKFSHEVLNLFSYQTGTIIGMLMAASENISVDVEVRKHAPRRLNDANTLVRVLCHKKDKEASKFLKRQYRLPASSGYDDDNSGNESPSGSAVISDLLKRSASIRSASARWSEAGQSSLKSFRKRFQEASFDMRKMGW